MQIIFGKHTLHNNLGYTCDRKKQKIGDFNLFKCLLTIIWNDNNNIIVFW